MLDYGGNSASGGVAGRQPAFCSPGGGAFASTHVTRVRDEVSLVGRVRVGRQRWLVQVRAAFRRLAGYRRAQ